MSISLLRKVIITCAPTGATRTPSMSSYLPVTKDVIADVANAVLGTLVAVVVLLPEWDL